MRKRFFDLVFSLVIVIFLSPIYILISSIIIIFDGLPVLFIHKRVGKDFKIINVYKFRTMTQKENQEPNSFDPGDRSRLTFLGKILRATKMDETPQFFNVLKGDMSIVGPRPEVQEWVNYFSDDWKYILKIKPGITDPASIYFRNEESILSSAKDSNKMYAEKIHPKKVKKYLDYIESNSISGDILIILKTIVSVLRYK